MAEGAVSEPAFDIERADILAGVPHGFFGSAGGAHQFGYGGPGALDDVRQLRRAAAASICRGAVPVAPAQVHSANVITLGEAWPDAPQGRPEADALVTARKGLALAIVSADCAPVLLADRQAGVVAAAHAGWRGTVGGIIANTLDAMCALGARPEHIAAAIGPAIAQRNYEVDAAMRDQFSSADDAHFVSAPLRDGEARWLFDLPGAIAARLERCGVPDVEVIAQDTFSQSARYHSYRRKMSAGADEYGRQISMIALCP